MVLRDKLSLLGYSSDPRMEPFDHLAERLLRVLRRHVEENRYDTVFLVSHGGSINCILSVLSGGEIGTGKTVLKNVCISKLVCAGDRMEIDFYNQTPSDFAANPR